MTSNKAWYWLATGVLALGLNGAYQDGEFRWAHRLVHCSVSSLHRISDRGHEFAAMAEIMLGRATKATDRVQAAVEQSEATLDRSQARLQALQTKLVCERIANAQRRMAMVQAHRAIAQADVERKIAMAQAKMDQVRMITVEPQLHNCPDVSRIVVMPEIPKIDISNLPAMQIPDLPEIPQAGEKANGPI